MSYQLHTHLPTHLIPQMVIHHDTLHKEVVNPVEITEGIVIVVAIIPYATHHGSNRRIWVVTLSHLIVGWIASVANG